MRIHSAPMLSFLTRYLADAVAAEDIAQDAFVRAYFQLHQFDESRSFSKWLFTIAGNIARDHLRHRVRRDSNNRLYAESWITCDPQTEIPEEEAHLDRALSMLPDGLREPVVLHYQMDWSVAKIALHLKIQEGAVKVRLYRAREELRRLVRGFTEGSES